MITYAETQNEPPLTQTVRWIPVSERLPRETSPVQIATIEGKVHVAESLCGGGWFFHCSFSEMGGAVTHWAEPLKHPKELAESRAAELLAELLAEMNGGKP